MQSTTGGPAEGRSDLEALTGEEGILSLLIPGGKRYARALNYMRLHGVAWWFKWSMGGIMLVLASFIIWGPGQIAECCNHVLSWKFVIQGERPAAPKRPSKQGGGYVVPRRRPSSDGTK